MQNTINLSTRNNLVRALAQPLTFAFGFAAITAVAAQIAVPVKPVPFTFQTAMVVLSGAVLGARYGALSQFLYLAAGVAGLPVFANGAFGPAVLFGPTGGYLLAFPVGAFVVGLIVERRRSRFAVVGAMFLGNAIVVALGALYLDALYVHDLSTSLEVGAAIFSLWAVAKVFVASLAFVGVEKFSKRG
ncbi:MAG: biotin transporter BioY [Ignavibacteriales bacterium]|nr:biotin transporter BioY [Ignavibacteriales bacterium]